MVWVDAAVQGVLLGGLYALFATGLSLIVNTELELVTEPPVLETITR